MYLLLTVGAATMLYPFALMFSMATTSRADAREGRLIPRYWHNEWALFKKYLVDAAPIYELAVGFGQDKWFNASDIKLDQLEQWAMVSKPHRQQATDDWRTFLTSACPDEFKMPAFIAGGDDSPLALRAEYMAWLKQRYQTVEQANAAYQETAQTWEQLGMPRASLDRQPHDDQRTQDWRLFVQSRPPDRTAVSNIDAIVLDQLTTTFGNTAGLSKQMGLNTTNLTDITYDLLHNGRLGEDVLRDFFQYYVPLRFVQVDVEQARNAWQQYLRDTGKDEQLQLTPRMPHEPSLAGTWGLFLFNTTAQSCPVSHLLTVGYEQSSSVCWIHGKSFH